MMLRDVDIQQVQAPENWNPQMMPVQNCYWKNAEMYQGKNAGGFNYPQFDEKMFQQNMPTNGPVGHNQPNYNNIQPPNYDNQGMNYNNTRYEL